MHVYVDLQPLMHVQDGGGTLHALRKKEKWW